MQLYIVVLLSVLGVAVAPFPEEHPYNWANPYIEPWWQQLDKETQKRIYANWLVAEPFAASVARWKERAGRLTEALNELASTGVVAVLKRGEELGTVLVKGKQDAPPTEGYKKEGKTRYVGQAQVAWQNFQAAAQHALHLKLSTDRAGHEKILQVLRLIRRKKDAAITALHNSENSLLNRKEEIKLKLTSSFKKGFKAKSEAATEKISAYNEEVKEKLGQTLMELEEKKDLLRDLIRQLLWKVGVDKVQGGNDHDWHADTLREKLNY